jgi:hypothetical protein
MMFLRSLLIFSLALIGVTDGAMSVDALARCIMSEASVGNTIEKTAIGFACQRNSNHASNQNPTPAITQLAKDILAGKVSDPTEGANHWYSPRSMPKESQSSLCKKPVGTGIMDCSGGLETVCGTTKNYKPSWATADRQIIISGVRDCYYKFFKF